ncbi:hypothetical protein GN956_G24525 [Arapaima gigas]
MTSPLLVWIRSDGGGSLSGQVNNSEPTLKEPQRLKRLLTTSPRRQQTRVSLKKRETTSTRCFSDLMSRLF